ncbi:MAG TPA: hypothetical protein VK177_04780 [Flavobacteriales bacterium]|nr:hypothetical protein [Flavobacteriales bacterium]
MKKISTSIFFILSLCHFLNAQLAIGPDTIIKRTEPAGYVQCSYYDSAYNVLYMGGTFNTYDPLITQCAQYDFTGKHFIRSFPSCFDAKCLTEGPDKSIFIGGMFNWIGDSLRTSLAQVDSNNQVTLFKLSIDGPVNAVAVYGDTVFFAGTFTTVNGYTRHNMAAYWISQDSLVSFDPIPDGDVYGMRVIGNKLMVHGSFTAFDTVNLRNFLAAFDLPSLTLSTWNPNPDGTVNCIIPSTGTTCLVGGMFANIGGALHPYLAELNLTTGVATSFSPVLNGMVNTMQLKYGKLYLGGMFTSVNSTPRQYAGAIVKSSGAVLPWNPFPNNYVHALLVANNRVYIGGQFDQVNYTERYRLAETDTLSGALTEFKSYSGNVFDLLLHNERMLVAGDLYYIGPHIKNIVAVNASTGQVLDWKPEPNANVTSITVYNDVVYVGGNFTQICGVSEPYLAGIKRDTAYIHTHMYPNGDVTYLEKINNLIFIAGYFTNIATTPRSYFAVWDPVAVSLKPFDPFTVSGGQVYDVEFFGNAYYFTGTMTQFMGQPRAGCAKVSADLGSVQPWAPGLGPTGVGYSIKKYNDKMLIGGIFTAVNSITCYGFCAVDTVTGVLMTPNYSAYSVLAIERVDSLIVLGGYFTSYDSVARWNLCSLDADSLTLTAWDPTVDVMVLGLLTTPNGLVVYGDFTSFSTAGVYHPSVARFDFCSPYTALNLPVADTICQSSGVITLSGGIPYGGTYSGPGVTGNTFDPGAVSTGQVTITYTYAFADSCVTTSADSFVVDLCLGMDEYAETMFTVYPDPADDFIGFTHFSKDIDFTCMKFFTSEGRQIYLPVNGNKFDVSALANGLYVASYVKNNFVFSSKFIVNHR